MAQACPRLLRTFDRVVDLLAGRHAPAGRYVLTVGCRLAEEDHARSWRQFAHASHRSRTVCVAAEAEEALTEAELLGAFLHEAGHLIATDQRRAEHVKHRAGDGPTPETVQAEADAVILELTGLAICYNDRTCQSVDPAAFQQLEMSANG
jgi:hypothetical protein